MIEHDYHLYISLGSNLGSRADNIMSCVKYINHHPRIQVKIQSEIIETLSIINCQQNYYNTVLLIQTNIFIFVPQQTPHARTILDLLFCSFSS